MWALQQQEEAAQQGREKLTPGGSGAHLIAVFSKRKPPSKGTTQALCVDLIRKINEVGVTLKILVINVNLNLDFCCFSCDHWRWL
jgi:hypothetical protein